MAGTDTTTNALDQRKSSITAEDNNMVDSGSVEVLSQIHNTYPQRPVNSRCPQLFDPKHPQHPLPILMSHFIGIFFNRYASEFTFLDHEETLKKFQEQTLSPLLSNCIAAITARYATHPQAHILELYEVAEIYSDNARDLMKSVAHIPNMDTLHSAIILSWSEYKNQHMSNFRHYVQMAMTMAKDLGLSEQSPPSHLPESERKCRINTWASIMQLHLTSKAS